MEKAEKDRFYREVFSQTIPQEIANSIVHGIGAAMSVAALVLLVVFAAFSGSALKITSFAIYGATLILLFISSTLLHALRPFKAKSFFLRMDHISIYYLISGTYTPLVLVSIGGKTGWIIFGVMWSLTAAGTVIKAIFTGKFDKLSTLLYVAMGWIVVFFIKIIYMRLPLNGFILLVTGGILYTAGTVFYLWRKLPFSHMIWHIFVLAGAAAHFFCILLYV